MNEKLNKYFAVFDYLDKTLIVLFAASGGISIIYFVSVIGAPLGIAGVSFSIICTLTTGIIKKLLKITRHKKKKHNKIVILAKSKLNSVETLIFQALVDFLISHEEYQTVINEKQKYEKIKENIRMIKSDYEKDKLSKNNKNIKENNENA